MEKEKNSEVLNTNQKNNIDGQAVSFISQKQIVDKKEKTISEFLILSMPDFTMQDWIFKPKFIEIANSLKSTLLDYPLKKVVKGNKDEGKEAVEGKALRITSDKDIFSIEVYTQSYGEAWSLSHTHQISKNVFDAYVLVVKNDQAVSVLEKESKAPKNFSLNLG